jgi:hypothetical protein
MAKKMGDKELAFSLMGIASELPPEEKPVKAILQGLSGVVKIEEKSFDELVKESQRAINKSGVTLFVSSLVCFVVGLVVGLVAR